MYFTYAAAAALSAVLPLAAAQTYTDCNPLDKTCPADTALSSSTFSSDFTQGESSFAGWTATANNVTFDENGAAFTINQRGQAPTIQTNFYFFFGRAEVVMKAASGTGIVSSIVLESDDLDEVDWEALGGDTTQIETNYFGKGDTTTYDRATWVGISSPQENWHTYTVDWTETALNWYVDGNLVRTLAYNDASSGTRFPQTPMNLRIGIWAGGDSDNAAGTIEWAGGETDYSQAPFTMYVKSVSITNNNPGCSYTYGDKTGSYSSIVVNKDGCDVTSGASSSAAASSSTTSAAASSASSAGSSASSASGAGSSTGSSTGASVSASATGGVIGNSAGVGALVSAAAASTPAAAASSGVVSGGAGGASGAAASSSAAAASSSAAAAASASASGLFTGAASTVTTSVGAMLLGVFSAMLCL
ncbi:glycoside hydrolase family 16 protein [Aspergillus aculeatus ATCC 16872]|uniref:Crh-like protein n=1 Tax=Aspergillus aculeatus (strain ATCC 16872 / CBS 172.66 / WB 5094) TaxID=690307 RepID=A0A1L9X881_ASPA1|nr:glycoside hydrolase family 16 protein [Aspergillus aculeatus ATCC 16872]OJK04539.1 glycoside hydrolase family 16 protein [Aspergillus aculeatus ATCC 16872]